MGTSSSPNPHPQIRIPKFAFRKAHVLWGLTFLLLILLIAVGALACYLGPLPDLVNLDRKKPVPAISILDQQGELLYEITDPERGNYQPVPLQQIPDYCQQAVLATEDHRFYQHPGIDWLAIVRAVWRNWREGETIQGGSTLTQQLARILLLDDNERYQRSLRRKLREAVLAWRLEQRFSKDAILNLYLNNVYFGHYATGMEAAAQAYFGRSAHALDLAQCAMLAGLPQYPAGYNPLENPEAAKIRQKQVLVLMVSAGFIDQEQAARAAAEPLQYASTPFPIIAPHFVFFVQSQLEAGVGQARLAQGGLRIITTLDIHLQEEAKRIIQRRLAELNRPSANLPQQRRAENAALVALDPATGSIRALVGSPDYFDQSIAGAVNGALVLRQPGSTLKPIAYAVALDPELSEKAGRSPWTAATVLADVATSFPTAENALYEPLNYDLAFHGPIPLRYALANSYNIPAVRTLQAIGIDAFVAQARRHGISTFAAPGRYGLALVLGGAEVRLLELTAAYAPFAHSGRPVRPLAIARIEDEIGQTLFDAGLKGTVFNPNGWALPTYRLLPPVLDPRTAYLITDILSDNDARAAAFGLNSPLHLTRKAAVKTGTTTDWRDNWTIGYTPDLLTGVWVGNADNTPIYGASGIDGAAPIWHDFMIQAHKTLPEHWFQPPPGLLWQDVCTPSGLLATDTCPRTTRELFIAGTEPKRKDDQFRVLTVDLRTGHYPTPDTPPAALGERVAWNPPPDLQAWASEQGMLLWPASASAAPTPFSTSRRSDSPLQIISPEANTEYFRDPRLPDSAQQLQLAISYTGSDPLAAVSYWLDGEEVARVTTSPWTAWWQMQPGSHTLRVLIKTQNSATLRSTPLSFAVPQ